MCTEVECGSGVYIRSLVHDIGVSLGTVCTMIQLIRLQQHDVHLCNKHTVTLDELTLPSLQSTLQLPHEKRTQYDNTLLQQHDYLNLLQQSMTPRAFIAEHHATSRATNKNTTETEAMQPATASVH